MDALARLLRATTRRQRVAVGVAVGLAVAVFVYRTVAVYRLQVRAPTPREGVVLADVDSLEPSLITVPVRVALAPLVDAVENALPRRWGSLEERVQVRDRDRLSLAVAVERGPFSARFEDSLAIVSTTLAYRVRAWYDPPLLPEVSTGCALDPAEPAPRLSVTLVSPLTLDREWMLRSRVRAGAVAPVTETSRDKCTVTALNFNVTGRVVTEARDLLRRRGPDMDRAIADVDVRERFARWWGIIAEPVRLSDDVWLVLAPYSVARSAIRGAGREVRTVLSVGARPRVVLGERPQVTPAPLPPLDTTASSGRLVVHAEARADYGEISQLVEAAVVGRTWQAGRRSVRVRSVALSGVGDGRIALAVRVDGDVRGTLYLVGTPAHDPATGQLTIPDLDFDVASRGALVSGAAFLARVGLAEHLRQEARWPAAPAVDWAREQVERGFNARLSDEVRLEGSVDSVRIVQVVADTGSLRVRAAVTGVATLVVEEGRAGTTSSLR